MTGQGKILNAISYLNQFIWTLKLLGGPLECWCTTHLDTRTQILPRLDYAILSMPIYLDMTVKKYLDDVLVGRLALHKWGDVGDHATQLYRDDLDRNGDSPTGQHSRIDDLRVLGLREKNTVQQETEKANKWSVHWNRKINVRRWWNRMFTRQRKLKGGCKEQTLKDERLGLLKRRQWILGFLGMKKRGLIFLI